MPLDIDPSVSVFDAEEFQEFLETLDAVDSALILQAISNLLPKSRSLKPGWVKTLPNDICQLRLGPTRHKVSRLLPESDSLLALPDQSLLVRIYYATLGSRIWVLGAFDKLANPARYKQKQAMELASLRKEILRNNLDK